MYFNIFWFEIDITLRKEIDETFLDELKPISLEDVLLKLQKDHKSHNLTLDLLKWLYIKATDATTDNPTTENAQAQKIIKDTFLYVKKFGK